ncbi:hypothetical protein Arnit_1708 [Arcobacter nitrofigilis DSM 7299]|uniref:Uncharacterized protein n=1 Tax=Arcobacter nitrofigilis (strain ATCC 33309 / DSM 7299 / CCUG 15893 / LMG 7604 / NCTC 12251 / CI) TaxID=572480 RepID=D5UZZ3_ARCNC|nr:hypothetical protein [Arcobacter nitrofigilis]ADG93362.1 hypothetical protein Arnit_1708 [Arcobacter nitrofigilis DSM 7299]
MELLQSILDYIAVPLYLWIWWTDRKIVKLEAQKITNEDLAKIYKEIKEMNANFNNNFITQKSCDFRHGVKGS